MTEKNNLENPEESPSSLNLVEKGLYKTSPKYKTSSKNLEDSSIESTDSALALTDAKDLISNQPPLLNSQEPIVIIQTPGKEKQPKQEQEQEQEEESEPTSKLQGVYNFLLSLVKEIVTTLVVLKICTYFSR